MYKSGLKIAAMAACAAIFGQAYAASVKVTWAPPATFTDGAAIPAGSIQSYDILLDGVSVARPVGSATVYNHIISPGLCVLKDSRWTMTATVEGRPASAQSAPKQLIADACTPEAPVTPPPTPSTWARVSGERENFTLAAAAVVRFGIGTTWVQKQLPAGTHACVVATFGSDPARTIAKSCERSTLPPAPPSPPVAPTGLQVEAVN